CSFVFFFQAEDGIRDRNVTGVQTCALPIFIAQRLARRLCSCKEEVLVDADYLERLGFSRTQATSRIYGPVGCDNCTRGYKGRVGDRKSTRLNSSHVSISYAVFCLKKKNTTT